MRLYRKTMIAWLVIIPVSIVLLVLIAGRTGLLKGTAPDDLGVRDGRLKPPSNTENSVTSQAALYPDHPQRDYADIAPIELLNGDGAATITKIAAVIDAMERAEVIKKEPDYLRVQFTSPGLQFVDDAEFWFDPGQNAIQVRSAARLGRKDFGMNRKHIEAVRSMLAAQAAH